MHTCLELSAAEAELPLLCSGELSATASSGLGSNAQLPVPERRIPKAVFFGGGIPEEEMERVKKLVSEKAGSDAVRFLRVTRDEVLATGATGPNPDIIARLYREKVADL